MTTVGLTLFEAGACRHPGFVVARGGGWRPQRFPALAALVEQPGLGPILFDTGYAPRVLDATRRFPYRLYRWATPMHVTPDEAVVGRLAARGLDAESVRLVVLSHWHADHVGGLLDFPHARVVCTDRAWADVRGRCGLAAVHRGILPDLFPSDLHERLTVLRDDALAPLPPEWRLDVQGWDLVGDGSLWGIPLPGHAEGQMGMLLQSPRGPVFLLADAVWTMRTIRDGALPHALARLITADPAAYRRTVAWLRDVARQRPDLAMIPSHCTDSIRAYGRD